METGQHHEDSKNSSEEMDQSEQAAANDDTGTGRSYECVFCKRGFTTAQALGGHMNIHRKDRARTRPPPVPSASSKPEDYASSRFYPPFLCYPSPYSSAPETQLNCQMYFPPSRAGSNPPHVYHADDHLRPQKSEFLNPFREDWSMSLSLQVGPSHVIDGKEEKRQEGREEDELDLELRLGHDP